MHGNGIITLPEFNHIMDNIGNNIFGDFTEEEIEEILYEANAF